MWKCDGSQPRGFARLGPEARKEMASLGGKTAHATGMAHKFDRENAQKAVAARWAKAKREKEEKVAVWPFEPGQEFPKE